MVPPYAYDILRLPSAPFRDGATWRNDALADWGSSTTRQSAPIFGYKAFASTGDPRQVNLTAVPLASIEVIGFHTYRLCDRLKQPE